MKGKQAQISHAMPPELLAELDRFVDANPGLKRASAINIAIRQMLRQGIVLNLQPADQGE
jgi:metal-responsive CopG/Arc/MetJ family transcriptional regulator